MRTRHGLIPTAVALAIVAGSAAAEAEDFVYRTNNNGTATLMGYFGPGGAVTIPDTIDGLRVTCIGPMAFTTSIPVTSVTIPPSVTSIDDLGFWHCQSLTRVTIPGSVTNIGGAAFLLCTSLTNIELPDSVTSIGSRAFQQCDNLLHILIPDSVTSLGPIAFAQCNSLTAVDVDPLNPVYSSMDGVLFNKDKTTLLEYAGGKVGTYTVPDGVKHVADNAFWCCTNLIGITFSPGVASIGSEAFDACWNLSTVVLPDSLVSLGPGAFLGCTSLTDITIPPNVTNFADSAFAVCTNLSTVTISPGVVSIGNRAFSACANLNSVSLPDSLQSIGAYAFHECTSLAGITIPASVSILGEYAFSYCSSLQGVFFQGNAPSLAGRGNIFYNAHMAFVYYLSGTSGWGQGYAGRPTVLLDVRTTPPGQTAEVGDTVRWEVGTAGPSPLYWLLYHNTTNLVLCSTNANLRLTDLQFSQAGVYTAVLTNIGWAATSSPALLQVIAPVQRRPVPGIKVRGEPAGLLNLDYADSLAAAHEWTPLGTVSQTNALQYFFDLSLPLPPQRFYRGWQTGAPGVSLSLDLRMVTAITVAGEIGDKVQLDYINRLGPTDAWVALATMTLASPSQDYFDVSALGQPKRLYRIIRGP